MKPLLITSLSLLITLSTPANAQVSWRQGNIILSTGIQLWGELSYQPHADLLLVRIADKVQTYTSSQFSYTDQDANRYHQFAVYRISASTS